MQQGKSLFPFHPLGRADVPREEFGDPPMAAFSPGGTRRRGKMEDHKNSFQTPMSM